MLQDIGKNDISPSVGSPCVPILQIFIIMSCANLQSLTWSLRVSGALCSTNLAAKNMCKHLQLTLAIQATDYLNVTINIYTSTFPNSLTPKKVTNHQRHVGVYFSQTQSEQYVAHPHNSELQTSLVSKPSMLLS